ncbi:hypothetical protein ACHAP5_004212 [Fusarium lateritium]
MVRSLSDESQHDGIGRWFDDDEEAVQSPQQVHTEEEQEAQKQSLDVKLPEGIREFVHNREQVAEWRLLNAVADVPTASSVPSLNWTEETMSFSTRSVHEATESGPPREERTWPVEHSETESIHSPLNPNPNPNEASDSSSDISGRLSPALSSGLSSGTAATSPSTHELESDGSIASMEDYPENEFQYPVTHYTLVESFINAIDPSDSNSYVEGEVAAVPDDKPLDKAGDSSPYRDEYGNNERSQNHTTREEHPRSEISTNSRTTNGTGVLQNKDQPKKRGADDDGDDRRMPSRSKRPRKQEEANLRLACPFYKFDPVKYRRCHSCKLQRNSYVKQHLLRSHMQPIHCDICLSVWPNEEKLREHRRAQQCVKRPYIAPEGITSDQKRKLQSRLGSRDRSESDQWFEIYTIVFPDSQKPKSAYLDGELSEDIESLREYMERRGTDIMMEQLADSSVLQQAGVDSHELQQQVQNALTSMFDGWNNQRRGMGGEASDGRSKRFKPTHEEFLAIEDQGCRRTDTASTSTSLTMEFEDRVDHEQTTPATSTS